MGYSILSYPDFHCGSKLSTSKFPGYSILNQKTEGKIQVGYSILSYLEILGRPNLSTPGSSGSNSNISMSYSTLYSYTELHIRTLQQNQGWRYFVQYCKLSAPYNQTWAPMFFIGYFPIKPKRAHAQMHDELILSLYYVTYCKQSSSCNFMEMIHRSRKFSRNSFYSIFWKVEKKKFNSVHLYKYCTG